MQRYRSANGQPWLVAFSQMLSRASICFCEGRLPLSIHARSESTKPRSQSLRRLSRFSQSSSMVRYSSCQLPSLNSLFMPALRNLPKRELFDSRHVVLAEVDFIAGRVFLAMRLKLGRPRDEVVNRRPGVLGGIII